MNQSNDSGNGGSNALFIGCFIALITTAFGFVGRLFLINTWATDFDLDPAQAGRLAGIGIWPFAVSIIFFSLIIDKIGYKVSMFAAFFGHLIWVVMGVSAYFVEDKVLAYNLLYWGSLVLALANGTVEAFINPVVATIYSKDKTKWLNILHAGWPGGLVLTGIIVIFMGDAAWAWKVGLIALPTFIYGVMLAPLKFPVSERVASGVSYREMLQEFGILGALIVGPLLTLQLLDFFQPESGTLKNVLIGVGVLTVVAFGLYTRSLGRPLMFILVLIMMPLAITEIGTDGWITAIMEETARAQGWHAGWVLVYTSAIMLVLRFYAGPIVHKFSPLGLLALSAALAIGGLYSLSSAAGVGLFLAATLYGFGKTFFWPTMLGVVSEQCPKGGALTLNAISGIGMLAVGTVGTALIGAIQVDKENQAIVANAEIATAVPTLVQNGEISILEERSVYEVIKYKAINEEGLAKIVASIPDETARTEAQEKIEKTRNESKQKALATMAWFPVGMLVGYLVLIGYFVSRGGYKPIELGAGDGG